MKKCLAIAGRVGAQLLKVAYGGVLGQRSVQPRIRSARPLNVPHDCGGKSSECGARESARQAEVVDGGEAGLGAPLVEGHAVDEDETVLHGSAGDHLLSVVREAAGGDEVGAVGAVQRHGSEEVADGPILNGLVVRLERALHDG